MKKKLLTLLLVFFCIITLTSCHEDIVPIDEIAEYKVYVDMVDDGSLSMKYYVEWEVLDLDDKGRGVEFVDFGIPNSHCSNISTTSDDVVKGLEYFAKNGGSYLRIKFNKEYMANSKIIFNFSFNLTHLFTYDDDFVYYNFQPGWFDEIKVENLEVYWSIDGVYKTNTSNLTYRVDGTSKEYYLWKTSLDFGQTMDINVTCNRSAFSSLNTRNSYEQGDFSDIIIVTIVFVCIVILFIVIYVVARVTDDGYYSYRGFSGTRRFHWWCFHVSPGFTHYGNRIKNPKVVNSGRSGTHGGGFHSSCACACACAGGGRAGCSRKDFTHGANTQDIIKHLK